MVLSISAKLTTIQETYLVWLILVSTFFDWWASLIYLLSFCLDRNASRVPPITFNLIYMFTNHVYCSQMWWRFFGPHWS